LCFARQDRLGQEVTICRILLQQQLPSQSKDVTIRSALWEELQNSIALGQPGERHVFSPDILLEAEENIRMVRENLKAARSRQRSYADTRRRELSFEVGDFVYMKVSPIRGTKRFGVKGKLAPRYIGPYQIQARRGEVVYQLSLPENRQLCMVYSMCLS
jgi:hypothetical protein